MTLICSSASKPRDENPDFYIAPTQNAQREEHLEEIVAKRINPNLIPQAKEKLTNAVFPQKMTEELIFPLINETVEKAKKLFGEIPQKGDLHSKAGISLLTDLMSNVLSALIKASETSPKSNIVECDM